MRVGLNLCKCVVCVCVCLGFFCFSRKIVWILVPNYIRYFSGSKAKQSKLVVGVNVQATTVQSLCNVLFTCTRWLTQILYSLYFILLSTLFLFCIPIRFSVHFCYSFLCFGIRFGWFRFWFGLVFGWHLFFFSLLNTVFNGANVYNRCAYGPMRYNLTENTTKICFVYIFIWYFSVDAYDLVADFFFLPFNITVR